MKWYNNLEDHQTSWLSASYTKEKERYINYKEFVDIVLQAHIYVSNLFLSRSFRIDRPRQCYVFIPELALCEDFLKQFFTHRFLLTTLAFAYDYDSCSCYTVLPGLWVTLGVDGDTYAYCYCRLSYEFSQLRWLISTISIPSWYIAT